jgi:hypothetical protein
MLAVPGLAIVFVVHQDRYVNEIDQLKHFQEPFSHVHHGNFATGACVQPFFRDFGRHVATSFTP